MDNSNSYCGINCTKCPVYIATVTESLDLKQKVADDWGKLYNRSFTAEEMVCYGCKKDVRLSLCSKCDIEVCNIAKGNDNCRICREYPCNRISEFESNLKGKDMFYM